MATEIIVSIKPSGGGDYTSLASANLGRARDLVTAGELDIWECYEGNCGVLDMSITADLWVGSFENTLTIRAASSSRHAGVFDTSKAYAERIANIYPAYVDGVSNEPVFITLQEMQIDRVGTLAGLTESGFDSANSGAHIYTTKCIIRNSNSVCTEDACASVTYLGTCIIYDAILFSGVPAVGKSNAQYCYYDSCTFYGFQKCIVDSPAEAETRFCLFQNVGQVANFGYFTSYVSINDNYETEALLDTSYASDYLIGPASFVDTLNEDFHVSARTNISITADEPSSLPGAAFEDIDGEVDSVFLTYVVGADQINVPGLPTQVIVTIKPAGGGDYSSFAAANTARARDLTEFDEVEMWECYGGGSCGSVYFTWYTDEEYGQVSFGTTKRNKIIIFAAENEKHSGVFDIAKSRCTSVSSDNVNFEIKDMQILGEDVAYYEGVSYARKVSRCIFFTDIALTSVHYHTRGCETVENCVSSFTTTASSSAGYTVSFGSVLNIYNCTSYGAERGYELFNDQSAAINCIAQNCVSAYEVWYPETIVISNCVSDTSELDGIGTDNIYGVVSFVNPASNNFHLAEEDTVARNAGVNLSYLGITTDIDGKSRSAAGAWDIGADAIFNGVTLAISIEHLANIDSMLHGHLHLATTSTLQLDAVSTIRFLRLLEAAISNQNALNAHLNTGYRLVLPIVNNSIISITITKLINYLIISNIHTNNITYIFRLISKLLTHISNTITIDTTLKLKTELQAALANNNLTLAALIVLQFLASNISLSGSSSSRLTSLLSKLSAEQELNAEAILEFTDLLMVLPEFQFTLEEMVEFERFIRKYRGGILTEITDNIGADGTITVGTSSNVNNYIVITANSNPEGTITI